jgi:short-subunit dehydrogenase
MLITGSTKGLGKAIREKFKEEYNIIGVARSGGDYNGDLRDAAFRRTLIEEVNPQVVINNAGMAAEENAHVDTYMLNLVAVVDLNRGFANKMSSGHIINISSVSAAIGLTYNVHDKEIDYIISKKALSEFTQLFQNAQKKNLKICSIEPGFVMTDMGDILKRYEAQNPNDYITKRKIKPMEPSYIAGVIQWIIQQPEEVVVSSIRLMNQCYG